MRDEVGRKESRRGRAVVRGPPSFSRTSGSGTAAAAALAASVARARRTALARAALRGDAIVQTNVRQGALRPKSIHHFVLLSHLS